MNDQFVWFITQIPEIDSQHQELFSTLSKLRDYLYGGKPSAEIEPLLGFLEKYAMNHFGMEESYMQRFGYPESGAHHEEHEQFIEDVKQLRLRQQGATNASTLAGEACDQLGYWLVDHIGIQDKKLGEFLKPLLLSV